MLQYCLSYISNLYQRLQEKKDADIVAPIMFNPPEGITPADSIANGAIDKGHYFIIYT